MTRTLQLCLSCADLLKHGGYKLQQLKAVWGVPCQNCQKKAMAGHEYTVTLDKGDAR